MATLVVPMFARLYRRRFINVNYARSFDVHLISMPKIVGHTTGPPTLSLQIPQPIARVLRA